MSHSTVADGGTAQQVQEKAQDAAGQAREKAQEGAERAREGLRGQLDQRSTQAGQQVGTHAEDIRSVAQQLREQGKEGPAKLAEQAADRTQRLGGWLEESDGDQLLHDAEDFARRNPWAIALGGLALGFAASRMLRASSSDRYQATNLPPRRSTSQAGLPAPPRTVPGASGGAEPPVATVPPAGAGLGTERF
jgi:hypothetical protein